MTVYYVDSAAGSNTAPYDTWGKAALSLATIDALDVAGDTIYVASTHAETSASAITLAWAGTATSPVRIICADKTSGAPPATIATGGSVTCSGANVVLELNNTLGNVAYYYGLTFISARTSSAGASGISLRGGVLAESCSFQLSGASGTNIVTISNSVTKNCTFKFGAVGQQITPSGALITGGSILSGGTSPTTLFGVSFSWVTVEDLDLTNASSSINLFATATAGIPVRLRKMKMPASWSGSLNSSTPAAGSSFELINCDNAGTNYIYHRQTRFGDITQETTLVRTGGSSDGTTTLSWKFVSLAASGTFPIGALQSAEICSPWNDVTGSQVTCVVELLHDNATGLKNDEIWMEVRYFADSGDPLGAIASSAKANVLATGTTLSAGVGITNWNVGAMSNANSQKMSVSFTPQLKGPFYVTIYLTKAAYTVYVDRTVTVTSP